jgi:hypothetical protein
VDRSFGGQNEIAEQTLYKGKKRKNKKKKKKPPKKK